MLDIIKREIRDRKISLLAYCGIGLGLLWLYVAIFPSISASASQFEKLFQSYPKGVLQAMGIQELSFNTLEKFLAVEMFSFLWPIIAILFGVSRAGNALAGEIEKGTLGLYLSLPVSRAKIFLSKYAGSLVLIFTFATVSILGIFPLAYLYNEPVYASHIIGLAFVSVLFMWSIFAASLCLSAIFSERSKVYMTIGGVLVLMYAANVIASLKASLGWLHNISIFHFYNSQDILSKGDVHASSILLFIGLIVLFTSAGMYLFNKRDIFN